MKSSMLLLTITACMCIANCLPPPHPDVVALRHEEELLHPIHRSPALRNPHLLKILPLTSLLHEGEKPVYEREANKVSRKEIYKVLTHAGFIPRRLFLNSAVGLNNNHIPFVLPEEHINFHKSSYFPSQDILQYL